MPPLYRMLEVCVYSLTNFLPFLAMALYPFRRRLRFSPAVAAALVAVLTLLQMGLGLCAAFFTPGRGSLLSAVSTGLYAVFYFLAVRAYPGKTLFTLLMISNLANLVVIAAKCLEGQLFPALAVQSYRWSFALMMLAVEAVLFLPLLLYVRKVYTPAVEQETSGLAWRYLWLIPATFYLIWYYVIYGNTNLTGLEIALRPSSTIVLLFINTGAALVYYVVARLVLEQEKLVALQQKNYALAMQSLQYENLQERIAEARQAKHDVRHHIALLQDCLRRKDYDAMQAYLDRYQETLPDARQLQFCGNAAVNAVLSYFAQQAAAQQVEFSVKAQLPEYTGVADPDWRCCSAICLKTPLPPVCRRHRPALWSALPPMPTPSAPPWTTPSPAQCAAPPADSFPPSTPDWGWGRPLSAASLRSTTACADWSRETECSAPPCCWSCHRRSCEKRPPGCLTETSRRSFCMSVYSATTGASSQ